MKLKRLLQEQITNTQAQVNTYTKDSVDNNLDGTVDGADLDRSIDSLHGTEQILANEWL
jgi:hypothetical protein